MRERTRLDQTISGYKILALGLEESLELAEIAEEENDE